MAELSDTDLRETVRRRYAAAALGDDAGCGCGPARTDDGAAGEVFGGALYGEDDAGRFRRRPSALRSAAASRPRSPTCTRARPCSTSAPAVAPTSS